MGLQPPRAAKSMSPLSNSSAESDSDQHDTDIDQPYRYHEKTTRYTLSRLAIAERTIN